MSMANFGMFRHSEKLGEFERCNRHMIAYISILEDFDSVSPYVCTFFLQTVYAIEKLLAGFNVQPRIGMNQSLITRLC